MSLYSDAYEAPILRERLKLNQERLNQAINQVPGWEGFNGSPESATGVAAQLIEVMAHTPSDNAQSAPELANNPQASTGGSQLFENIEGSKSCAQVHFSLRGSDG